MYLTSTFFCLLKSYFCSKLHISLKFHLNEKLLTTKELKKLKKTTLFLFMFFFLMTIFSIDVSAETYNFNYKNDEQGHYLTNGISEGDTNNYDYGHAPEATFDEEKYVNYGDEAYLKKSVAAVTGQQGLFNVTLDVKGNQTERPIDLVLVIDYSSSMKGEKLNNALKGLQQFGEELSDSLTDGHVRIGIVAYNRLTYSTADFSTDMNDLEDFLRNTAEPHSGTFMQKGLLEGQRLLAEKSRPNAKKMLVHIGDGSANASFLPRENAQIYPNNGEIIDYNGYHTSSYMEEFQTESNQYYTSNSASTDANAIQTNSTTVTDNTLGTIVSLKKSGDTYYSIAANPSLRGEYISRNIASDPKNYLIIDENLSGLGTALKELAGSINNTIHEGLIIDPMGENILLQGAGNFTEDNYQLKGWRKMPTGEWLEASDLLTDVVVTEENQVLHISTISLGKNERLTLTYQIRLNTETNDFKGDTWFLCNDRTTLQPTPEEETVDFPIPAIKAPTVQLKLIKNWENIAEKEIPEAIQYQVTRKATTDETAWSTSEVMQLTQKEGYQKLINQVTVNGAEVALPKFNNRGEDFVYQIEEVNVPAEFDSIMTKTKDEFILTNRRKEVVSSTTDTSTNESLSSETATTNSSAEKPIVVETTTTTSELKNNNFSAETNTTAKKITKATPNDRHLPKTNETQKFQRVFLLLGGLLVGLSGFYLLKQRN
ncbi:vWA domain-containing protein [Enterococcus faecalis]|uniref:vWA domain-containing protein n=1 Tax=Enterococcus faecalis TaxID=1351 RepID=UPI000CF2589C|nr:VWA domain-containing protein [Enterococcus faecalis]EGO2631783.1 VWA domain-containing protein [Enterococcus faecalis]EGO7617528.1 VWA domain-containing protein [Enterococcus faecalis]EGO7912361.1 VWA domain-containing protein [Enterococcus faecalis]EHU8863091.1 VWA domain-containing protein [Enterococcus faecalis]EIB6795031.1 VWA domain-containing protein [Enterococcus faecalis]